MLKHIIKPQTKDLKLAGRQGDTSLFLASKAKQQSHLQISCGSWLSSRLVGAASVGATNERFSAQVLKVWTTHCVLDSVLAGITPLAALSPSGEVTGPAKRLALTGWLVESFEGASVLRCKDSFKCFQGFPAGHSASKEDDATAIP